MPNRRRTERERTRSPIGGVELRPIRLLALAILTAVTSGLQAQEEAPSENRQSTRIIWQKTFEGGIEHRNYFGLLTTEPDVGISSDTTRATPVRMVATSEGVVFLDSTGDVERIVPRRDDPWPEGRDTFQDNSEPPIDPPLIREGALTAPNGEFYVILESHSDGSDSWVDRLRVFNADGSRRFEVSASKYMRLGQHNGLSHFISPNSDYIVVFNPHDWNYLYFYDTRTDPRRGRLIHYVEDNFFTTMRFDPVGLGFSEDGTRVLLNGFKTDDLLEFNDKGRFLRRIEGGLTRETGGKARQAREAVKRMLEPKWVEAKIARGHHLGGVAEFGLLRGRPQLGTYASGGTLYLFELIERESRKGQQ